MAKKAGKEKSEETKADSKSTGRENLPKTKNTGVNGDQTKSVLVSGVLEVSGQVRFGDGTDVGLTVTETDMVVSPDGNQVHKFVWSGSKRRGVDRRTIHELRDQYWDGGKCYVPQLCCECPTCWLYGFTGTTQDKSINAKSRVLYASSVSIEEVQFGRNTHSRNQVDEKTQKTAGAAGIHEEEIIVAGVHFPSYTALGHVLDWEIGAFAHALLENVNNNRYTAASRGQGGFRFAEHESTPLVIVDESVQGIFPLTVPKIAGWENNWQNASKVFQNAMSEDALTKALGAQGFKILKPASQPNSQPQLAGKAPQPKSEDLADQSRQPSAMHNILVLEESGGIITVKQGAHTLMTRYTGAKALGYLRQKQLEAKEKLATLKAAAFHQEINSYVNAMSAKAGAGQESGKTETEATNAAGMGVDADDSSNE